MKKYISMLLLLCVCFSACSCGAVDKNAEKKVNVSESIDQKETDKLVIAPHYKTALDYEQIEPLLKDYFSMMEESYANSDKQNLETFVFCDEYTEVVAVLRRLSESTDMSTIIGSEDKQLMIACQKKLALLEPFLRVEVKISERNLLIAAGHQSNEEWFESFESTLAKSYEHYNSEE